MSLESACMSVCSNETFLGMFLWPNWVFSWASCHFVEIHTSLALLRIHVHLHTWKYLWTSVCKPFEKYLKENHCFMCCKRAIQPRARFEHVGRKGQRADLNRTEFHRQPKVSPRLQYYTFALVLVCSSLYWRKIKFCKKGFITVSLKKKMLREGVIETMVFWHGNHTSSLGLFWTKTIPKSSGYGLCRN